MGNSVSVVVAVWGTAYASYITRWWSSLEKVNRKPDEIVLVTDTKDSSGLLRSVPEWVDIPVRVIKTEKEHYQEWWTVAVHAATKQYIAQMPIDDQFAPQALDAIDETEASLIIDRCEFLSGGEWGAVWTPDNPRGRRFAPAGISPFHRRLLPIWDKIPSDTHWNDYLWYLLLAREGVSYYETNNLRMIHDLGHDHKTMSGVNLDYETRAMADAQLSRARAKLGV